MKYILILLSMMLVAPLSAQSIEYQWENIDGKQVNLSELKGKPVLLHFWASWCTTCRSEMPAMSKWVGQHQDVQVVMVSMDSSPEDAVEFYEDKGIQAPLNLGDMRVSMALGVRGLPTTIIIGADGEIKKRHLGDLDWADDAVSQEVLRWL